MRDNILTWASTTVSNPASDAAVVGGGGVASLPATESAQPGAGSSAYTNFRAQQLLRSTRDTVGAVITWTATGLALPLFRYTPLEDWRVLLSVQLPTLGTPPPTNSVPPTTGTLSAIAPVVWVSENIADWGREATSTAPSVRWATSIDHVLTVLNAAIQTAVLSIWNSPAAAAAFNDPVGEMVPSIAPTLYSVNDGRGTLAMVVPHVNTPGGGYAGSNPNWGATLYVTQSIAQRVLPGFDAVPAVPPGNTDPLGTWWAIAPCPRPTPFFYASDKSSVVVVAPPYTASATYAGSIPYVFGGESTLFPAPGSSVVWNSYPQEAGLPFPIRDYNPDNQGAFSSHQYTLRTASGGPRSIDSWSPVAAVGIFTDDMPVVTEVEGGIRGTAGVGVSGVLMDVAFVDALAAVGVMSYSPTGNFRYWSFAGTDGLARVSFRFVWRDRADNSVHPADLLLGGTATTKWLFQHTTPEDGTGGAPA